MSVLLEEECVFHPPSQRRGTEPVPERSGSQVRAGVRPFPWQRSRLEDALLSLLLLQEQIREAAPCTCHRAERVVLLGAGVSSQGGTCGGHLGLFCCCWPFLRLHKLLLMLSLTVLSNFYLLFCFAKPMRKAIQT